MQPLLLEWLQNSPVGVRKLKCKQLYASITRIVISNLLFNAFREIPECFSLLILRYTELELVILFFQHSNETEND